MTVVTPAERTAAAALTNAVRYTVRPVGPLIAGAVQQTALGAPLVLAGAIKGGYDLALWHWARHMPLHRPGDELARTEPTPATVDMHELRGGVPDGQERDRRCGAGAAM